MLVPADANVDELIDLMRRDKKAGRNLSMILLRGLGDPYLEENIDAGLLRETLEKCKQPVH